MLLLPAARPASEPEPLLDGDPVDRLRAALDLAAEELTALAAHTTERAGEEVGAIFEAQALFARDPGIADPALAAVAAGRDPADAILAVTEGQAQQLDQVDDDYFRARAADVRDIGRRIAGIVRGDPRPDLWRADGTPAVLLADDLDPSAVASLRRELVAGIALAGGAPTGHTAIVARALGIPLVLGLGPALADVPEDTRVAVDGTRGRLIVGLDPAVVASLPTGVEGTSADAPRPGGSMIDVCANVASPLEATAAAAAGADGIGLVRTELLFLGRHSPPSIEEQRATYRRIRTAMGERPVVFRTLDVGGDKPASWTAGQVESNPALGVRGIRLGQREPDILAAQLRALVEAASAETLRVLLPMVSTREEVEHARVTLEQVVDAVRADGLIPPAAIHLGVMIEVPSAAIMADALAPAVDFFSIGTNDLVQYTLAADRTNPALADLASPFQPAIVRLIDQVCRAGAVHGRHVAVCGEAAADPAMAALLVGLGVDELSVTPAAIPAVRSALDGLDPAACRALAMRALACATLDEVRAVLG